MLFSLDNITKKLRKIRSFQHFSWREKFKIRSHSFEFCFRMIKKNPNSFEIQYEWVFLSICKIESIPEAINLYSILYSLILQKWWKFRTEMKQTPDEDVDNRHKDINLQNDFLKWISFHKRKYDDNDGNESVDNFYEIFCCFISEKKSNKQ